MDMVQRLLLGVALASAALGAHSRTIEMEVNGLVCAFCAQGIEKTLRALPQTDAVWVSLEDRVVAVALKGDADIPDATLERAITDSGFALIGVRRTQRTLDEIRAAARADDD